MSSAIGREGSMSSKMSLKGVAVVAGLVGYVPAGHTADPPKPVVSEDASAAVAQMSKSLLAEQFSFQAHTLRVSADTNGRLLHIGHSMKVTVHRPDKLLIDVTGDDGSTKLIYDGK